jgi:translation initiation factor RLI1
MTTVAESASMSEVCIGGGAVTGHCQTKATAVVTLPFSLLEYTHAMSA